MGSADFCLLSDFETLKENFQIIDKCFITLSNPILFNGMNVHLRDTFILAPAGFRSLAKIGSLYAGKFYKECVPSKYITRMSKYLEDYPEEYRKYALQDSLIPLIHSIFLENFNFSLGSVDIPVTLSNLSGNYIRKFWNQTSYHYQVTHEFPLGHTGKSQTPLGLNVNSIGVKVPLYISSYRGGRNESFLYGVNNSTT